MANILILSAGRRVSLVRGFQSAVAAEQGLSAKVLAADMYPDLSAACQISDGAIRLPHVFDDAYSGALMEICRSLDVRLVVPTIDTELPILADLRADFRMAGIELLVSSEKFVAECSDKRRTAQFFENHNLPTPALYSPESATFPVLVKPYDGSCSAGIVKISSPDQITDQIRSDPKNIYCQYIDHAEHSEYTVDLYYDRTSKLRCVVPRRRLEVRGGEVAKAVTERNEIVSSLFKSLNTLDGARGCLTLQLFRHNQTGEHWYIEINARFGGGYPLSRLAGADFQSWLIGEYLLGRPVETFDNWRENMLMLRYDAEVIIDDYRHD